MFVISLEENGSVPDASWSVKGEARYALMPAWDGQNLRGIDAPRDVAKRLGAQAAVTAEELFKLRGGLLALKPGESLQFYVKESKSQGSASDLAGHYSWSETVKDGLRQLNACGGTSTDQDPYADLADATLVRTPGGATLKFSWKLHTECDFGAGVDQVGFSAAEAGQILTFRLSEEDLRNWDRVRKTNQGTIHGEVGKEPSYPVNLRATLTAAPLPPDEVEVSVEAEAGYLTWLPKGNLQNPNEPGNVLSVSVKVHKKGDPGTPRKAKLKFSLAKVSKEKGVCMNWPEGAAEGEGLRFRPEDYGEGSSISVQDRRNASTREAIEEANLVLSCFDYGAWGTLHITATDEQGRDSKVRVRGKDTPDLYIPRDENQNHIADSWEIERRVSGLSAAWDQENDPPGRGFATKGDGLTLYEEYRGFRVQEAHEHGDPNKKDLFVCDDTAGQIAAAGISLFEKATGLKVHRVKKEELGSFRIINKNGSGETHEVDQHGVLIVDGKAGSAPISAPATPGGVQIFGPPVMTSEIRLPKGKNFDSGDGLSDVAHELCHSVGIDHHGEAMWDNFWTWKRKDDGSWQLYEQGLNVDEDRVNWLPGSEPIMVYFENPLKEYRHGDPLPGHFFWDEAHQGWMVNVGGKGGEFSGDQECLLRYYDKQAYKSEVEPKRVRYIPDERQWKMRSRLCESPNGTGVNEPHHPPQSRYGDATTGNCKAQIVVNDKYAHK